jgi:chromosome segregation ATPase
VRRIQSVRWRGLWRILDRRTLSSSRRARRYVTDLSATAKKAHPCQAGTQVVNPVGVASPVKITRPTEVSKRRRRSLSFNGDSRIQQLQDEVETLKDQLSRGADYMEVDKLKESLANIKKKSLKLENEKMALERSTNKAIEEMRNQLEANNEELEFLRHNGGDQNSEELEKLKKSVQREKAALETRIASLTQELSSKTESLARIEKRMEAMEEELRDSQDALTAAREAEARALESLEETEQRVASAAPTAKKSVDTAQARIATLEAELSRAVGRLETMSKELAQAKANASLDRSTNTTSEPTTSSSVAHFEKTIRQLQREISALTREKAALQVNLQENDDLLAEKDEEIFALKANIPIPPSPTGDRHRDSTEHDNIAAALEVKEAEIETLKTQRAELEGKLTQQVENSAELAVRVESLQGELAALKSENSEVCAFARCLCLHSPFLLQAQRMREQGDRALYDLQEQLDQKDGQMRDFATESSDLQRRLEAMEDLSRQLSLAEEEKSSLQATVKDMEQQLSLLTQTQDQLQEAQDRLKTSSEATEEMELVKARCAELETETNRLGQMIKDLEAEEFVARQGKQAALEHVSQLENNIKALEEQLVHDEEIYEKMAAELKEEKA